MSSAERTDLQPTAYSLQSTYSHLSEPLALSDPAPQQRRDVVRMLRKHELGRFLYEGQQVGIAHQIGNAHLHESCLLRTEQLAGPAQLEIAARDFEPVV